MNKRLGRALLGMAATAWLGGCATPQMGHLAGTNSLGQSWTFDGIVYKNDYAGPGTLRWADGGSVQGDWSEPSDPGRSNLRRGSSVLRVFANGDTYTGPVGSRYAPLGTGRMVFKDSGCVYEGEFRLGFKWGKGEERCPDGKLIKGSWREGKLAGDVYMRFPDGRIEDGNYRDGKRSDESFETTHPNGDKFKRRFVLDVAHGRGWQKVAETGQESGRFDFEGTLVVTIPFGPPASQVLDCAALPTGWQLIKGRCDASGLEGDIVAVRNDGSARLTVRFEGGKPVGTAVKETLDETMLTRSEGKLLAFDQFGSVRMSNMEAVGEGAARKRIWRLAFDAQRTDDGSGPERWEGRCLYDGEMEPCTSVAGKRTDALQLARDAESERRRKEAEAERLAEERAERAEQRAQEMAARAERDAERAAEKRRGDPILNAINESTAQFRRNVESLQAQDARTAQLVAQARQQAAEAKRQAEAAKRDAEKQAEDARLAREQRERESQARRDQLIKEQEQRALAAKDAARKEAGAAAPPPRVAQAEGQRNLPLQAPATIVRNPPPAAVVTHPDGSARSVDAGPARAGGTGGGTAGASGTTVAAVAAAPTGNAVYSSTSSTSGTSSAGSAQAAKEAANAEQQRQAEQDYLVQLRAGLRLKPERCLGGEGFTFALGDLPKVGRRVVSCVAVAVEGQCTGSAVVATGRVSPYVGGASCFLDPIKLQPKLDCKPEQVKLKLVSLEACS